MINFKKPFFNSVKQSSVPLFGLLLLILLLTNLRLQAQPGRSKVLFNSNWKFHKGDVQQGETANFNDSQWRTLDLPHDWSIEGPFSSEWASATAFLPAGIGWYRKTFIIPERANNKNIYAYFDGVYNNSEVWINGHYLGKRPNGFISFQYELTPYLKTKGKNLLAVRVDHSKFADSRWYTGSGIYRNVYLITTSPIHIDLWGTAFSTVSVEANHSVSKVMVTVKNTSSHTKNVTIKATLYDDHGRLAASNSKEQAVITGSTNEATLTLDVTNPLLWSVEKPQLYHLHTALYIYNKKMDELIENVGIRKIRFSADSGFFLNGKNRKIKGVCLHDDAGALGVAVPEEVWKRRLLLLKECGVNALRMSHNPHADYVYDLCDQLGLLVMDEAFDEWVYGKNKWIEGWNAGKPGKDGYHDYFKQWGEKDLCDMVKRDRNHPSIIMWSIGNEIDYPNDPYSSPVLNTGDNPQIYGKGYLPEHPEAMELGQISAHLVKIVKKQDQSRPVTAALAGVVMSNTTSYPENLDIVGYNYLESRYAMDHGKYPKRVIYGSENGMGYGSWQAVDTNENIFGQFLWTGIDYMGEARKWPARSSSAGLMDLAGFPKSEYYFRKSLWTSKPMIYLVAESKAVQGAKRQDARDWNKKPGDKVNISCYTNCNEAELFINGKSIGRKAMANAKNHIINWTIDYEPGILVAKGYKNSVSIIEDSLQTSGEPYAIEAFADLASFESNAKVAPIEIKVVDRKGIRVYGADNNITVKISGSATLLGLESGNSSSHESYQSNIRNTLNGHLLAYIQAKSAPGKVLISLTSPGLQAKKILINNSTR